MRSVFFSHAFPGRGYSYLFSMSNEEEEPSTPTDQETHFSSLEAKLVVLSLCFEALAHKFDARSSAKPTCHRIQTSTTKKNSQMPKYSKDLAQNAVQ